MKTSTNQGLSKIENFKYQIIGYLIMLFYICTLKILR